MGKMKYLILKAPDKIGGDLILNPDKHCLGHLNFGNWSLKTGLSDCVSLLFYNARYKLRALQGLQKKLSAFPLSISFPTFGIDKNSHKNENYQKKVALSIASNTLKFKILQSKRRMV
ncbi:MAG: hypothetical protein J7L42_01505 [Elusimicrobia bacterium]|nr:hypothetical protein [Elusimicrobiota bacterium]